VVNVEQLLVVAHVGVGQYALVFKGSNQGMTVSGVDAEALMNHLQPYELHVTEDVTIEIPSEVQTSRE